MESSETLTHLPLDFSVTMMNLKLKNEMNNNSTMVLSQNNHQTSSAFKVVTPRGKSDGELCKTSFIHSLNCVGSTFKWRSNIKHQNFKKKL